MKFRCIEKRLNRAFEEYTKKGTPKFDITYHSSDIETDATITAFRQCGVNLTDYITYCLTNYENILTDMINETEPDYIKEHIN